MSLRESSGTSSHRLTSVRSWWPLSLLRINIRICNHVFRVMALISTPAVSTMRESGMLISGVAGAECITVTVQCMKENGTMT